MSTPLKLILSLSVFLAPLGACATSSDDPKTDDRTGDASSEEDADVASDSATDSGAKDDATSADVGSSDPDPNVCQRTLSFPATPTYDPACIVTQHVGKQTSVVTFPCAGGAATATFQGTKFVGKVSGKQLTLTAKGSFPFQSCVWDYVEVITADIDGTVAEYTYRDETSTAGCESEELCPANGKGTISK